MQNTAQNHSVSDSYSASEAAGLLGVSIPTLKRMVAGARLESFRTPGGHLRITAKAIEAAQDEGQSRPRPVHGPSPVLQNRREHLEELTLEAQEHRAKRELEKLRSEDLEEARRQEADAQARQEATAQHQAEIKLQHGRLRYEKTLDEQKRQAERQLQAFRCRWKDKASRILDAAPYQWLSATQRKEIIENLEAEVEKRPLTDQPRMPDILARSLEALVEPLKIKRDAQERRQHLTEEALRSLSYLATEAEKLQAGEAIAEALRQFDSSADNSKMSVAAQEAVRPVRQAIEKRLLDERLLSWATNQLPFMARTDHDKARIRRECQEILAELPLDATEAEAQEALRPTVREASRQIKQREAEKDRQSRKQGLVQNGVYKLSSYLWKLKNEGEITVDDYLDSEFEAALAQAVRRGLNAELNGDETTKEVDELVREIVDLELE